MAYFDCIVGGASGDGVALIVECDPGFAGSVITADNGEDSFAEACPSVAPYTVKFEGIPIGTYTISGVADGVTVTIQFTVLDYTTSLHNTPNGATVTPVNDIQTWLHCAEIWDKNYTAIAQVLADASTIQALIASNNAVDYMARSTSWASAVAADSNTMTYIGANDYCANKLLADSTWRNSICYSTYFESVLNTKVPTMTSNTAPSGEVAASSYYSASEGNWYPWGAFRNPPIKAMPSPSGWNIGGNWGWCSNSSNGAWVRYKFLQPVCINRVDYAGCSWSASWTPKIQGSNNGNDWTDIATLPSPQQNTTDPLTTHFANSNKYLYIRVYNPNSNFYNRNGVQFQFYGRS